MNGNKISKVVFRETEDSRPKVLFCYILKDADGFVEVRTTDGNTFLINKNNIIFTKEGCY